MTKEKMKNAFVPGKRRPWALDTLELTTEGENVVNIGLDTETHDAIIRAYHQSRGTGHFQTKKIEDYVFSIGFLERVRQFHMNNCGYSFSDWHAQQLLDQVKRAGIKIKKYANVGSGTTADQALNAFYLLDEETEIHIFEIPSKVIDAKRLIEKLGFGNMIGNKIQFHEGDVAETLPEVAKKIGGFDLIDLQFVIQHLRGDSFGKFCEAMATSLNRGGLAKINEMMLGEYGFAYAHKDDDAHVQEMRASLESYFRGDGSPQSLSFLKLGWDSSRGGGHAWHNQGELVKDIKAFTGDALVLRPDLEITLPKEEVTIKSDDLLQIGLRYVVVTLASAMEARAQALEKQGAKEAGQFRAFAEWAWKRGKEVDDIVTSKEFKAGYIGLQFPEAVGIVLQKI